MLIKRFVVVSVLTLMLSSCSTGYETRSQMWNDYEQKTLTYKYAVWGEIYNWKERGFKFGNVASYTDVSLEKAIKDADIVVLLVDHASFKSMDLSLLSGKQVIDTRGIWS